MSNQKVDRRVQRTRQGLHQALVELILEKRYDKITVQDIIDRANVGRSTFYTHFLDKEDLLIQGLRLFGDQFQAHAEHDQGSGQLLQSLVFFEHAHQNQAMYRAMLDGGGGDFMLETGRKHITADVQAHLDDMLAAGHKFNVPLPVVTHFLAGAMMSVLTWWLNEGMPYRPAEVNDMYQTLALPSIEAFLGS